MRQQRSRRGAEPLLYEDENVEKGNTLSFCFQFQGPNAPSIIGLDKDFLIECVVIKDTPIPLDPVWLEHLVNYRLKRTPAKLLK